MNTTTTLRVQKIDRRKNWQTIRAYRPGQSLAAFKLYVYDKGNGHVVAVDLDALRADREARSAAYGHEHQFSTRYDSMDAFLAVAR